MVPDGRDSVPEQPDDGRPTGIGSVIHIHEDDCGMRNIYPLVVREHVSADIQAAAKFGEEHLAPSGVGWTAMYMTEPPPTGYAETGLTLAAVAAALEPIMPRVRQFRASIGSYIDKDDRDPYGSYEDEAWAFGTGPDCYIKLESEGALVKAIWFDFSTDNPNDIDALRRSIEVIHRLVPSFVADYFLNAEVLISDPDELSRYFDLRLQQISEFSEYLRSQREKDGA